MDRTMKPISEQGCAACRHVIYTGSYDWRVLPCSPKRHAYLYRCEVCGSNWEVGERAAWEITADEAEAILRDAEPLAKLRSQLVAEGFRPDSYDLGDAKYPSETYVLKERDGDWVTFYAERGHENSLKTFPTFEEASQDLLRLLNSSPTTRRA
jgi:hypothetical protein